MLRIGICDDERTSAEQLYLTLEPLLREDEEIIYEFSNGVSAVNWLKRHPGEMELLFLDVEMEPVAVTKENMDEVIIKGGFHSREEVYLNEK